jgi:probable addiction module antidote protein
MFEIIQSTTFSQWLGGLKDRQARMRIHARLDRLAFENHCQGMEGLIMAEKFTRYDTADYLKTDSDMAAYLDACLEEAGDDPAFIAQALGVIARARGMSQLARDTGLARENLYKALSADGNPEFGTILKVIKALGLKLHAQPVMDSYKVDEIEMVD